MISNGNRTEWSTIQGVIGRAHEADLKLRARLPVNCTTQSTTQLLPINRINKINGDWEIFENLFCVKKS